MHPTAVYPVNGSSPSCKIVPNEDSLSPLPLAQTADIRNGNPQFVSSLRREENGRRSQFADKSVEAVDNFVQVWLLQMYPAIRVVVSRFFAARRACPVHSAPVLIF